MKNVAVGKGSYYHPSKTVSLKFFWEKPNEEIKKVKVKKKKKRERKKILLTIITAVVQIALNHCQGYFIIYNCSNSKGPFT